MTETATAPLAIQLLPALGQALLGGLFAGLTTTKDGTHCAIVLLPDAPAGRLSWSDAMAWAEGIEATLPTRPVAAALFAHLKPQFEEAWYWTSEPCDFDGSCAWGQGFGLGSQGSSRKSYEGRCRAVRLIPISS
jgi:hypothetical protein